MMEELQTRIQQFHTEYLDTPAGQKHLAMAEAEPDEVRRVFAEIRRKHEAGQDVTDDVLLRLLPYNDTQSNREKGHRISTWPCISKDVRAWFEGAGWKRPEDWTPTARLMFEGIDGLIRGQLPAWNKFLASPYRKGFAAGFISPILFCLDEQYPIINSKVVKTYRYCTEQLGKPDDISARLDDYLQNAEKIKSLQKRLALSGLETIWEWDIFCHYMVSKRLGGRDLTIQQEVLMESTHVAWLFVANPQKFRWQQAFDENGVHWTGSKGAYAQKMLREQVKVGDRVFGYQAGPFYELCSELVVTDAPHLTAGGTWAVNLRPVRWLEQPVSLSTLKNHALLSELKFLQQTQLSISGISETQLAELDALIKPAPLDTTASELPNPLEQLIRELREAQNDTAHPKRYEQALAAAFQTLGFEAEQMGGSGKPDVLVRARLGSNAYSAVIEAKTCAQGGSIGLGVNYQSVQDHREEHMADHALVVAPAFSGGKLVTHAAHNKIGLLTTEALIGIIKHHDQFPFSLVELRRMFQEVGASDLVEAELGRVAARRIEYLQLTTAVLQVFHDLQLQQENSQPISASVVYHILLYKSREEDLALPDFRQIGYVIDLLSNPVLSLLAKDGDGYVLSLSLAAASQRVAALLRSLSSRL